MGTRGAGRARGAQRGQCREQQKLASLPSLPLTQPPPPPLRARGRAPWSAPVARCTKIAETAPGPVRRHGGRYPFVALAQEAQEARLLQQGAPVEDGMPVRSRSLQTHADVAKRSSLGGVCTCGEPGCSVRGSFTCEKNQSPFSWRCSCAGCSCLSSRSGCDLAPRTRSPWTWCAGKFSPSCSTSHSTG